MPDRSTVLAIDPGRDKCGLAVVARAQGGSGQFEVLYRGVAAVDELPELVSQLGGQFALSALVVGNGTNSPEIARIARDATGLGPIVVDEKFSTIAARKRFFEENPPRGLMRLVPLSLQTPGRAFDDYVAVILAEQYLAAQEADNP